METTDVAGEEDGQSLLHCVVYVCSIVDATLYIYYDFYCHTYTIQLFTELLLLYTTNIAGQEELEDEASDFEGALLAADPDSETDMVSCRE